MMTMFEDLKLQIEVHTRKINTAGNEQLERPAQSSHDHQKFHHARKMAVAHGRNPRTAMPHITSYCES